MVQGRGPDGLPDTTPAVLVHWASGSCRHRVRRSGHRGDSKLQATLEQLRPTYGEIRLPTSTAHIRDGCLEVVHVLFDKEPFFSNAWSDEECKLTFRATHMRGRRRESRWTRRARKAFHYVDRFLSITKCLPKMTATSAGKISSVLTCAWLLRTVTVARSGSSTTRRPLTRWDSATSFHTNRLWLLTPWQDTLDGYPSGTLDETCR